MDTKVVGIKSYPLPLAQDMEEFIRKVAYKDFTHVTRHDLAGIQNVAQLIVRSLDGN